MRKRPTLFALLPGVAVTLAVLVTAPIAAANGYFTGSSYGYDISYPQRNGPYPDPTTSPSGSFTFGIVGVNGGKASNYNSYLANEYRWVTGQLPTQTPSLYMNLNYPAGKTLQSWTSGPVACGSNKACQAHNYGWNAALHAMAYATSQGASAGTWWLDIETANSWSPRTALNAQVIQGALDYLRGQGVAAGVYSTTSMWLAIAGNWSPTPGAPTWISEGAGLTQMPNYCSPQYDFGGAGVAVVQYWNGSYDLDYACP